MWKISNLSRFSLTIAFFSPEEKRMASDSLRRGKDGSICIWDWEAGVEMQQLKIHKKAVWGINFSKVGEKLVTGIRLSIIQT